MAVISTNHKGEVVKHKETANDDEQAPSTSLASMNRAELEAYATDHGIDNPDDKEQFPNMDALRDAIADVDDDGGTP